MLDANNTRQITFQDWTLRVRFPTRKPVGCMLLLHGWTGDENSMWVFVRNPPENVCILAPRGPHTVPEGGYSWRQLQPGTWGMPSLDDLQPAAAALIAFLDEYAPTIGVDVTQLDVAGFSQGGALTNVLALLYPQRVRRAAVLAGFMPAGVDELLARRTIENKPFFVAHGTQDKLVSFERAQQSVRQLQEAGAKVTFCQTEVGHKVSSDCLRGLESFFWSA